MRIYQKVILSSCILLVSSINCYAKNVNALSKEEKISDSKIEKIYNNQDNLLKDALTAYYNKDWKTSVFLFKKLHVNPQNITEESLYLLIMAESFNSQYKQAVNDCDLFIKKFPVSQYVPLVTYQKGKNLFYLEDYEHSILILSEFCHLHPKHELYPLALFIIAENFYTTYNFENAKPLYDRIVTEYANCSKAKDAKYRLDIIAQRAREEKLLYLLRQTGEDYLSSKEVYEKSLKQYKVESSVDVNAQLKELRKQNEILDSDLSKEKDKNAALEEKIREYEEDYEQSIRLLKEQASELYEQLQLETEE